MSKVIELADAYANNGYREGTESHKSYARETRAELVAEVEKLEKDASMLRSALKDLRWAISITPYDDCDQLSHANKHEQHKLGTECPLVPKVLAAIGKADKAMELTC